jgi:tRNA-guanine family transglycosylase
VRAGRAADSPLGAHGLRRTGGASRVATRQALFPIVQGSMYADLRRECCAALVSSTPMVHIGEALGGRTASAESGVVE